MLEQKLSSLKTYRDKGLRTVIGCVGALSIFSIWALSTMENGVKAELDDSYNAVSSGVVACFGCSHYDADTNSCIKWDKWSRRCEANFPTDTLEEWDEGKWEPWKLTADGSRQEMPEISGETSHDRFKALCEAYGLPASLIWEVENKYNIREWVVLGIIIAETSGWKFGYGVEWCHNIWNVWNNDRWDRYCYDSFEVWLEKIAQTLNNSLLWTTQTLGCLSKAGSCKWWEDKGHIYASSDWNWERNMLQVLNTIYSGELGEINPERFNVRRVFTIYQ